ncbi:TPA: hypothetical protein DD449_04190 [Candidatus Berkelbacteria bacterium]|uniref:Uncharacterized protein n=1 Tax=Berkelbacteria bacterium GW2011_GWE1_39_12 TaxID=1618337 RepID=A0A0G4B349_9BACT|nr:MAG: hypothetical protein UT28_C0001G0459 [Berkelbacteria bacterium GW2011_GWE1_39_12]HBO60855.1 hypothetical protein [Candidatus Berkelbacteria bacterium]
MMNAVEMQIGEKKYAVVWFPDEKIENFLAADVRLTAEGFDPEQRVGEDEVDDDILESESFWEHSSEIPDVVSASKTEEFCGFEFVHGVALHCFPYLESFRTFSPSEIYDKAEICYIVRF